MNNRNSSLNIRNIVGIIGIVVGIIGIVVWILGIVVWIWEIVVGIIGIVVWILLQTKISSRILLILRQASIADGLVITTLLLQTVKFFL